MISRLIPAFICLLLVAAVPALAQAPDKAKAAAPKSDAPKADASKTDGDGNVDSLDAASPEELAAHVQGLAMTEDQRMGYAVGVQFGHALAGGKNLIDLDAMMDGFKDSIDDKPLKLGNDQMSEALQKLQGQMMEARYGANKKEGEEYLAANAKKDGVKTLPSGLQYKVITEGAGRSPKATDMVETNYRGTFTNGTEFDSSYKRNQPAQFPVNRVIAGWTEALQLMKEGSKWELYVPYALAYGEQGRPPQIPPFSTLVFEVELLKIVDAPAAAPGTSKPVTIAPKAAPGSK